MTKSAIITGRRYNTRLLSGRVRARIAKRHESWYRRYYETRASMNNTSARLVPQILVKSQSKTLSKISIGSTKVIPFYESKERPK